MVRGDIHVFGKHNADESNKQSNAVFNTVIEFVNPVYDSLDTTAQAEYKDTATFIIRKLCAFQRIRLCLNTCVHQFFKGEKAWIQRAFLRQFFLASTLQAMRYISFSCQGVQGRCVMFLSTQAVQWQEFFTCHTNTKNMAQKAVRKKIVITKKYPWGAFRSHGYFILAKPIANHIVTHWYRLIQSFGFT